MINCSYRGGPPGTLIQSVEGKPHLVPYAPLSNSSSKQGAGVGGLTGGLATLSKITRSLQWSKKGWKTGPQVSRSVECDTFSLSVPVPLLCWLDDRTGIPPVEIWVLVCWWWRFHWSFARLRAQLSLPLPSSLTTTSSAACSAATIICPRPCKWWFEQPARPFSLEVTARVNDAGLRVPLCVHGDLYWWYGSSYSIRIPSFEVSRPSRSEGVADFLSWS